MVGALLCLLTVVFVLLGFSYLVWCAAGKETGMIRLGGQIIAVAIKLCALLILIGALIYCPVMRGKYGMMGHDCKMGKMMEKGSCPMMGEMKGEHGKMKMMHEMNK